MTPEETERLTEDRLGADETNDVTAEPGPQEAAGRDAPSAEQPIEEPDDVSPLADDEQGSAF